MKVIAFNGSPKERGNTFHALDAVAGPLRERGIEVEIIRIGHRAIKGCMHCGGCYKTGKCVTDDEVNPMTQLAHAADGLLLGAPVHYAGVSGTMKCFLDRMFFAGSRGFRHKVGAAVTAVRRSGGVSTVDTLNHYLLFSEMLLPSANYWNVIHGLAPGEAQKDAEGVQIMQVLGENMAWLMQLVEAGKGVVAEPPPQRKVMTNFVR